MKLPKHEHVEIMPWHRGYNEKSVDLTDYVEVCNWCREMHKYRAEPNSTSLIDRWNIGIYQSAYIPALCIHIEPREFGEAVASIFIHVVGCFENCGIDVSELLNYSFSNGNRARDIYKNMCTYIPPITRQVYYKGKNRVNRFDIGKLEEFAELFLRDLISLNNSYGNHLPFEDSLMLAMAKVQEREFKTHG